jgi:methyltransferase-like protein
VKRVSRDMMLFHARGAPTSAQRVARAREMLAMASKNPPPETTPYSKVVEMLSTAVAAYPDWYLEHDELGLVNDPVYFEDFIRHARSHELRYVAGAQQQMNVFQQLPVPVRHRIKTFTSDPVALEQYADFLWGTQYRDTVLCRADAPAVANSGLLAVQKMSVAAWLIEQPLQASSQTASGVRFLITRQNREIVVSDPRLSAVLRLLARNWPHSVPFGDLLTAFSAGSAASDDKRHADFLASQILAWYMATVVELWTRPTDFIAKSPARPKVTPLARLQAKTAAPIVNLRHEECRFADPFLHPFVLLMDGTRDRDALLAGLTHIIRQTPSRNAASAVPSPLQIQSLCDNVLTTLSNQSLLTA